MGFLPHLGFWSWQCWVLWGSGSASARLLQPQPEPPPAHGSAAPTGLPGSWAGGTIPIMNNRSGALRSRGRQEHWCPR